MKTQTNAKRLASAVKLLATVAPKRANTPILRNIHAVANGAIELSANDLERHLTLTLPCVTETDGSALWEPKRLSAALKRQSGAVELSTDTLSTVDGSAFPIEEECPRPVEDYPALQPVCSKDNWMAELCLTAGPLRRAIKATLRAPDSESSRYALGALFWEVNADRKEARIIGTDGRRMHLATLACSTYGKLGEEGTDSILIPVAACKTLVALLEKCGPDDSLSTVVFGAVDEAGMLHAKLAVFTGEIDLLSLT